MKPHAFAQSKLCRNERLNMNKDQIEVYKGIAKYEMGIDIEAFRQMLEERLKSIPFFGDILVFKEKRENIIEMNALNRAVDIIKESVESLIQDKKIDHNYIEKCQREIYFIFKFFFSAVYNQPDEEYVDYLSKFVSNCINEEFSEIKVKAAILNRIARYTKQHIEVLKYIFEDSRKHGWPGEIKNEDYNWQQQVAEMSHIEPYIIEFCFNDLKNDGFIFQTLGTFSANTYSPYEITKFGVQCLKMIGFQIE